MRNLKKILALVLALVMSLSLMATAGAKDFGDSDQINANYKTATDVLSELKVFGGYDDGTFKPQQNITRAEVAAIIYRIATGDVMGDKVALYSDMANSKLADLNQAEWARGQINYCYNAGIIKGVNNTDFEPNANVTGYAALTMILRALGYGQNGEFVGDQWEMNTASRARELGLLDKISEGQLGAPATREMVAEILFRTMLKETVTWTALNGYQTTGTTLGYQTFQLRDATGVVVANQWANLYGSSVLAENQTNVILTGEEKSTRIDLDTELTDIGEARHFYITGAVGAKEAKFIAYDQEGVNNNVYSNGGAAANIAGNKFGSVTGMSKDADTEQFINFDYGTTGKSEYRLEYQVVFDNTNTIDGKTSQKWFEDRYGVDMDEVIPATTRLDTVDKSDITKVTYTRVIPRGDGISADDIDIMEGIFSVADSDVNTSAGVDGYVFAGTNSRADVIRNLDLSDEMSWPEFYDTYIISRNNIAIDSAANGEWLKVVDNNNDGVAEYVFKTEFWMDKAIGTHTYKGEAVTEYNTLSENSDDYSIRYIDEVEVGDVIVYTMIDGVATVTLADVLTDEVVKVNYKTTEIETAGGETKGQSRIYNETTLDDEIVNMDQTEYNMYLDKFGYVRAYDLPGGTQYGLVTEAYFGFNRNGAFVNNDIVTVEVGIGEEQAQEFTLNNWNQRTGNDLVAQNWFSAYTPYYNNIQFENYLQPAISHLGASGYGITGVNAGIDSANVNAAGLFNSSAVTANSPWTDWDRHNINTFGGEFGYTRTNKIVSMTNIGVISDKDDESLSLDGAAQYAYERGTREPLFRVYTAAAQAGEFDLQQKVTQATWEEAYAKNVNLATAHSAFVKALNDGDLQPVYAVDYIQLTTNTIAKGARHYDIDSTAPVAGSDAYDVVNNEVVNAVHDTQYYIVDGTGHTYFTDYANVEKIDGSNIVAAYAVARDTNADNDGAPYWVADVIVVEVTTRTSYKPHSIALGYFESEKNKGNVHSVETLNNQWEDEEYNTEVTMIPNDGNWFNDWSGKAFYRLFNAELNETGELEVGRLLPIGYGDYNRYGIYTGTVRRLVAVGERGDYISVELDNIPGLHAVSKAPAYVVGNKGVEELEWGNTDNSSDVKTGDRIIIVANNDKDKAAFIIDLSTKVPSGLLSANAVQAPAWLANIQAEVSDEQGWTGGDRDDVQCVIDAATRLTDGTIVNPTATMLDYSKAQLEQFLVDGVDMTYAQHNAILGNGSVAGNVVTAGDDCLLKDLNDALAAGGSIISNLQTAIKAAAAKAIEDGNLSATYAAVTAAKATFDGVVEGLSTTDALNAIYDSATKQLIKEVNNPTGPVNTFLAAIEEAQRADKAIKDVEAVANKKADEVIDGATIANFTGAEAKLTAIKTALQTTAATTADLTSAINALYESDGVTVKEDEEKVAALLATIIQGNYVTDSDLELEAAKQAAKDAIDAAFKITEDIAADQGVIDAKAALEGAIDDCLTQEALDALYDSATKKFKTSDEASALTDAVSDAKAAAATAAADEALAAAAEALEALSSEWNVSVAGTNADAAKAAAKAAIEKVAEDNLPTSDVTITVSASYGSSLDAIDVDTACSGTATITLSATGASDDVTVDGVSSEVTWHYDKAGLVAAINAELAKITTASNYANLEALKSAIDTAIKTVASDDYALTIDSATDTTAGKKDFTYTVTYQKGVTDFEVKLVDEAGSVTLA